MYKVEQETLDKALKPFDVVLIKKTGGLAYIREVNVNDCQPTGHQISYSVTHLHKTGKTAWYDSGELEYQCNLFVKIAEDTCHDMGGNESWVKKLMRMDAR